MDLTRRPLTWLSALVVLCLPLVVSSCGTGGSGGAFVADAGGQTVADADGAGAKRAPEFALQSVGGEEVRLSDSAGKIRLVDFWATWCAPCREEIPMLNELQESYGERGFQILAISEEEQDVVAEFVDQYGVEYLNLLGTEEVAEAYGVLGLPAAYLLDAEGRVVKSFLGPKPRRVLVENIEALLDAPPST